MQHFEAIDKKQLKHEVKRVKLVVATRKKMIEEIYGKRENFQLARLKYTNC